VPGLRRGEVATLANVSIEYYSRLERGNLTGVSESVLDALARALHLDEAERAHLFDLAREANPSPSRPRRRASRKPDVRPSVQLALDAIIGGPAFVRNGRLDILAANRLGYALYSEAYANPERPANPARFAFLDLERAQRFYPDWDLAANIAVAILRTEAGRDPYDKGLTDLIGELSTRSEEFRTRWAAHNVRHHYAGVKQFHHPLVGDITLSYEAFELPADPGQTMLVYTAEPGSPPHDALNLLASWGATLDQLGQAQTAHARDEARRPGG
jgi:transcriptional regulator with XRE-family HTH domain